MKIINNIIVLLLIFMLLIISFGCSNIYGQIEDCSAELASLNVSLAQVQSCCDFYTEFINNNSCITSLQNNTYVEYGVEK